MSSYILLRSSGGSLSRPEGCIGDISSMLIYSLVQREGLEHYHMFEHALNARYRGKTVYADRFVDSLLVA